jgi:KDO2-lipid IV(A) lauroyltransferase
MWSRLAERSGATVLLMATNRLSNSDGFELFFHNLPNQAEGESASRQLNKALEFLIKKNPSQFLWSYNRYKKPSIKHFKKNLPTATKHDENISDDNLND